MSDIEDLDFFFFFFLSRPPSLYKPPNVQFGGGGRLKVARLSVNPSEPIRIGMRPVISAFWRTRGSRRVVCNCASSAESRDNRSNSYLYPGNFYRRLQLIIGKPLKVA
jgi:hypothetical protein